MYYMARTVSVVYTRHDHVRASVQAKLINEQQQQIGALMAQLAASKVAATHQEVASPQAAASKEAPSKRSKEAAPPNDPPAPQPQPHPEPPATLRPRLSTHTQFDDTWGEVASSVQ